MPWPVGAALVRLSTQWGKTLLDMAVEVLAVLLDLICKIPSVEGFPSKPGIKFIRTSSKGSAGPARIFDDRLGHPSA